MPGKIIKSSLDNDKHNGEISCLIFHKNHVYSGGADGKIKIWDKDLNLKSTIDHEAYIFCIAVNDNDKLYSSANDNLIRITENSLNETKTRVLTTSINIIQCLFCLNDCLYMGDDKGFVTQWHNDRVIFIFNLVEEVKSLAIEKNLIYTIRDLDAVVTEVMAGPSGKYSTKAVIPGKSPLILIGPVDNNNKKSFMVFCTRDGKGLTMVNNQKGKSFVQIWSKENTHEMIITSICGTEKSLFSGGFCGFVKMWTNIEKNPKLVGEINLNNCINCMCSGPDETVYTAIDDGIIRRLGF